MNDETRFADCGGPYDLSEAHTISSWEAQPTTCAEDAVIRYLAAPSERHLGKSLLHVGIGNGALFAAIGTGLRAFTGITISRPELDAFGSKSAGIEHSRILLANKHDDRAFDSIGREFDLIVDVNLKSFACCEKHFQVMMRYFAESLLPGGILVTALSGLNFGWAGNTAVAHTPGANTDPTASRHRILGAEGIVKLSKNLGLSAEAVAIPPLDRCGEETLWILRKHPV